MNETNNNSNKTESSNLENLLKLALQQLSNGKIDFSEQKIVKQKRKYFKRAIKFTEKELNRMPKDIRQVFAYNNQIIYYRKKANGVFEIRYQRNGHKIDVSSTRIDILKEKFIDAMQELEKMKNEIKVQEEQPMIIKGGNAVPVQDNSNKVFFNDFALNWLINVKKPILKPSTFKGDFDTFNSKIKPYFLNKTIFEIDRNTLQDFINIYVAEGKMKTATVLHRLLRCIFAVIADDYDIKTPMKNVVVPKYQKKKGNALTIEEERILRDYCINNPNSATSSGLLVLLYFGLRKSELKTLKLPKSGWMSCETSKQKMGLDVVIRNIPFNPMIRKVLPYIDFEKAKHTNVNSLNSQIKRLLPTHHLHELRYTFITRCKECGVNPEVVMRWDGHCEEEGVKASRVELGYTDYSEAYILREAEKVIYEI